MIAEIILVPDSEDALEGAKTSARAVARVLSGADIRVKEQISVCFGAADLQKAVSAALERSNIVITLGGMGAESDGLVKTVIAQGLNLPIESDSACHAAIQEYCKRKGEEFLPADAALALAPKGARVFSGRIGKSPGMVISSAAQHIVMLPDSEQEAVSLLREGIIPIISGVASEASVTRTIRTYGVTLDMVRRATSGLTSSHNPSVTILAEGNDVLVRVIGRGGNPQQAAAVCTPVLRRLVELLGDAAYGLDVDSLQAAVVERLKKKDIGIAIAESGSDGMLTRLISETPSGTDVLRHSVVVDTDKSKWERLGIPYKLVRKHGGCSEKAVVYLADAIRRKSGASIGAAISVGQGYDGKNPLGLVYIAVCNQDSVYAKKLVVGDGHPEERDLVLDAALSRTLNMIRLFVDYLPGRYMGSIPLAEALEGRTVTDLPGGDYVERLENRDRPSGLARWLGRLFIIRKTDRPGVKVRKVIFIIALLVFLGSGGYIGKYYFDAYNARQLAGKLQDMYASGDSGGYTAPDNYPAGYLEKFGALYSANPDVVGFISIPQTQMAYPVVQAEDNDFYLRRDYNKNKHEYGIPFMDFRADVKRPSENMVIYGHNMKDNQIFGEMMNYNIFSKTLGKDGALSYYKEHPIVNFSTVYEEGSYVIFSIFITNAYENQGAVFDYHNFIDAASGADLVNFADHVKTRSLIDTGVDILPEDKLITLSTCTYEFTDARFVVVARKLRKDESPESVDVSGARINPQPLMPDIWYSLYGGSRPLSADASASVTTSPTAAPSSPIPTSPPEDVPEDESASESVSAEAAQSVSLPASSVAPVSIAPSSVAPPESSVSSAAPPAISAASVAPPESSAPPVQSQESSTPPAVSQDTASSKQPDYMDDDYQLAQRNPVAEPEKTDFSGELSVNAGGGKITGDAFDIVSRVVQNEVGSSFHTEAIKAQAVAAYTYISFYNQSGTSPSVLLSAKADPKVQNAVSEVLGEAVWYGNKLALTTYYATSAGYTAASRDVWGGHYPYLVSVDSEADMNVKNFEVQKVMTYDQVYDILEKNLGVSPDGDPGSWFEILSYADGGYNGSMRICGKTTAKNGTKLTGRYVRESLFGLRSSCFTVDYDDSSERFTFTTYGYGHGVGMSQNGANQYASQGWSYAEILEHYYPGTVIG